MQTEVFEREDFSAFRAELLRRENKTDKLVAADAYHFVGGEKPMLDIKGVQYRMSDWAQTQIAQYTQIPLDYYRRMSEKSTELLAENVNFWFRDIGRERLIRIFDGEVIAFLSNRYNRIDNYDVISAVMEGASEVSSNIQMVKSYLTDRTMNVTFWDPTVTMHIPDDPADIYHPGINVRNSEVGAHAFAVYEMLIRHVCTNGLIFGKSLRKVHVGWKLNQDDDGTLWSNETLNIQIALIRSQAKDLARDAFDPMTVAVRLKELAALKNVPLPPTEPVKEAVRTVLGLTDEEKDKIWSRMERNNRYEFVQAVTNMANDYLKKESNPERGTELQEIGGKLTTKELWVQIDKVAAELARKRDQEES